MPNSKCKMRPTAEDRPISTFFQVRCVREIHVDLNPSLSMNPEMLWGLEPKHRARAKLLVEKHELNPN